MADHDDDFEDLVGDGSPEADDTAATGDADKAAEGADDKDPPASKDDVDAEDGNKEDKDDDADAPKDGADADKDAANADKDAAKDKMVPKAALDSEKRRRRELAARLKRIEDRFAAVDAEVAKAEIPDPVNQPAEHAQYLARETYKAQLNDKMNFSEYHAKKNHGEEVVTAAFEWANARMEDPKNGETFAKQLFAHADPYDYAVELHKAEQEAQAGGGAATDDPDYAQFLAWKAAQSGDNTEPAARVAPNQQPAARPTSLAQRSSAAGRQGNNVEADAFGSEFG